MKLFAGAVTASLVVAAVAAHAEQPTTGSGRPQVVLVSDFDRPYMDAPPPLPPRPIPAPAPRYGYERDQGYGYGPPERYDGGARGYDPGYGYAPALLPPQEVYAVLRDNGFSPLGIPQQRGLTYVIAVLDRGGEDGKLVIDARNGRILRFMPAFQWGNALDRMRYEPDMRDEPNASLPRGQLNLPPPTVIKAEPQALPVAPVAPHVASRNVPQVLPQATVPQPVPPRPIAVAPKPVPAQQQAAVQAKPAETRPAPVPAEPPAVIMQAKPAPQILPTQPMPQAQGLE